MKITVDEFDKAVAEAENITGIEINEQTEHFLLHFLEALGLDPWE